MQYLSKIVIYAARDHFDGKNILIFFTILGMVVSRILKANIPVQNGIVHLIDKPLMVVARSLYDYLMEEGMDPENREEDNEIHKHISSINLKSKFL